MSEKNLPCNMAFILSYCIIQWFRYVWHFDACPSHRKLFLLGLTFMTRLVHIKVSRGLITIKVSWRVISYAFISFKEIITFTETDNMRFIFSGRLVSSFKSDMDTEDGLIFILNYFSICIIPLLRNYIEGIIYFTEE